MFDNAQAPAVDWVVGAARRLAASRAQFVAELVKLLAAEIAPLPHDADMLEALTIGADESVAAGLYVLESGVDPRSMGAPPGAVQYARRLAQRGIPVSALLRAYRLGSSAFIEMLLAEIAGDPAIDNAQSAAAAVVLLRITTAYVDTVSELLVVAHEDEREAWSQQHSMVRAAQIKALLDGRDLDLDAAETALGYRLRQTHLAALLWFDDRDQEVDLRLVERLAAGAAAVHAGQHLLVPTDESAAALWLSVPDRLEDLSPIIAKLTDRSRPSPRVALGRPAFGAAGFRTSHRQACQARLVASTAGRRAAQVSTFDEVGAVALLCVDLGATRAWIADTLGALATDDENTERLRETARVFLNLGSSHTAAADRLSLHKNSVQYRIQKAEILRGSPLRTDRADVELALRACQLLGAEVLIPGT